MTLIYTHTNDGKLSQAGAAEIPIDLKEAKVDCVIFAAAERPPLAHFEGAELLYYPLQDEPAPTYQQFLYTFETAKVASKEASKRISEGKHVMSTCAMGLNRSGLVSALTLRRLTDYDNQTIIRLLRQKRNPYALSNPAFLKMLSMI